MDNLNIIKDLPNPLELSEALTQGLAQSQELLSEFLTRSTAGDQTALDPLGLLPAFAAFNRELMRDPARLVELQVQAWQGYMHVWQNMARRFMGETTESVVDAAGDRRFKSDDWEKNPFFDYLRQVYLLTAQNLQALIAETSGLDEKTAKKVAFYTQQYTDAIAPTNFVWTNPQVLHATIESGGRNLLEGMKNFLADIDPEHGRLRTRMVDDSAFELGRNVAVSPGKVVFQNELMQLIQYAPSTEQVDRRPLLIIPPWINKFYILDLQPKNSFIRWAVEQGLTVFVISWINPDERLADMDFEDYVLQGPMAALDAVEAATGERECNLIGYCLGGTLLGAMLALMKARGDDRPHSATFFTAMLDFSEPGDLGVFIDEEQLESIEALMNEQGYLDGSEMATTFNMLRANDLIWSFVVNNYLLGRQPMAFDLLFWNSDSTRMPARMHSTYLRKMYLENAFREPGGISVDGTPIDLRTIDVPACFVSAIEDHIAPWKSTFAGARLLSGPVKFILGQAGHVAGIINPPGPRQYGYFSGPEVGDLDIDSWLGQAELKEESWWSDWAAWVGEHGGGKVAAREPGSGRLPAIEDAPGSYVKQRIAD